MAMQSLAVRMREVTAAASRLGVRAMMPRLLHDGYNLVVHLAPTPVVAKVMTLFPGDDGVYWYGVAAREVAIAEHLRRCGVPVVGPLSDIDPGPHPIGETCFTLWTLATSRPGERPSPAEFAALLGAVRVGLASYPGDLAHLGAWRQTPRPSTSDLAGRIGDQDMTTWLAVAWEALEARLAAVEVASLVPAHGDAHVGNLLWAERRWVWCDFEDASLMPQYWDLACAVFRGPLLGEGTEWSTEVRRLIIGADAALAIQEEFALVLAARTVQSACGGLTLSTIGLAASDSAMHRLAAARTLLGQLGFL